MWRSSTIHRDKDVKQTALYAFQMVLSCIILCKITKNINRQLYVKYSSKRRESALLRCCIDIVPGIRRYFDKKIRKAIANSYKMV